MDARADLFKDMAKTQGTGPFPVHLAQISLDKPATTLVVSTYLLCPSWKMPENNSSCPSTLGYF
jgi:hypothetical protein